jgi:hypothetical protein
MRLAQDDHMIDALSPDRADQPFDNAAVGLSRMPIARSRRVTTVP